MSPSTPSDPFRILGVSQDAGEVEVRARYLELVKQFPPEREPDRFREIRAAYEAARDPLSIARRLVRFPDAEPPPWSEAIEPQRNNPPRMSSRFLLSLGNRGESDSTRSTTHD